jgi:hypothetical protein
VFEGEVVMEDRGAARRINVTAGKSLAVSREDTTRSLVPAQYRSAAVTYARSDASKLNADSRPMATERLATAYEQVLSNPEQPEPRLKLVEQQVQLEATGNNSIYELKKARANTPPRSEIEPATAAVSVAVYSQLGRNDLIASQLPTLQQFDTPTLNRVLQRYEINPDVIQRIGRISERIGGRGGRGGGRAGFITVPESVVILDTLLVRVVAEPATVRPGAMSSIRVTITNRAGSAVPEVGLTFSVGGGTFRGGGTSVSGRTNSDGMFLTAWNCQPCASAYDLTVRATKNGFSPWVGTVRIAIVQ